MVYLNIPTLQIHTYILYIDIYKNIYNWFVYLYEILHYFFMTSVYNEKLMPYPPHSESVWKKKHTQLIFKEKIYII